MLATIRRVFEAGGELDEDKAVRAVATSLGMRRITAAVADRIRTHLKRAARRGIVVNDRGTYRINCRRITDYPNELLEKAFYAAIGRRWWEQGEAIRAVARYLGFQKTGKVIVETFEKVIQRGVKRKILEREGERVRRTG